MLAKFINEKLAGKVENKQLFIDGDAEDPIAVPFDLILQCLREFYLF